jgi:uncharacterized protein YjbJ (UPF0337 family)
VSGPGRVADTSNHRKEWWNVDRMQLEGKWEQAKGRIKEAWGDLTDDDVTRAEGNRDQLVGTIREKTGETVEAIESKLDDIFAQGD